MTRLAAAQGVLNRLAEAASWAWRQDRVFRGAVVGAGVTLAVWLVRPAPSPPDRALPPLGTLPAAGLAIPGTIGAGAMSQARQPGEVPKIAPGRPLGDATVVPAPDGDRFGTFTPRKPR
ncbi:MAG: hypothetical protein BGO51_10175 [Rhodospirillales bacterium 69-11]|jgi:hypothetical protein|nr:hypothetical protein [Rhodospirillales bacterium]MBN8925280.1 hypothetical protein [Rhodospirillales bacterium]OJW21913.1 MAG: hypothetical protein BGO51_10175 [Rhodospirillales bacterium 69-11]